MVELTYFVTNDKWLRLPGGKLDKIDKKLLKNMGKHSGVVNMEAMLDIMQKETPEKFEELHREQNIKFGKILTVPEFYELATKANETMKQFEPIIASLLTDTGAKIIRQWRVDEHLTWRSIARRFSKDPNQILGMALCQRAAQMCGENYLKDPWN
jgi:phosphoserine aminotransferase